MSTPPGPFEKRARRYGLVVSDLHLFARRSDGFDCFHALRGELGTVSALVLNGDTFDFRWSTLPSQDDTIDAALAWLKALVKQLDGRDIHFISGNHDCLEPFRSQVRDLTLRFDHFHAYDCLLQLGGTLFLHGDCANSMMHSADLSRYRAAWKKHRQRGAVGAAAYQVADQIGLTRFVHQRYFPIEQTVARVVHYLDEADPDWRESTHHCYFGHTHLPFSEHVHEGIRFSNTGSAIRGMGFNPLFFELE